MANPQVDWKIAIGAAFTLGVTIVGGWWVVSAFTFGDVKTDVRIIREDIKKLTSEDSNIRGLLSGEARDLRKEISDTREAAVASRVSLKALESGFGEFKTELRDIKTDLTAVKETLKSINAKLASAPIKQGDVISYALDNRILFEVGGVSETVASFYKKQGLKVGPVDVYTASPVTAPMIQDAVGAWIKLHDKKK